MSDRKPKSKCIYIRIYFYYHFGEYILLWKQKKRIRVTLLRLLLCSRKKSWFLIIKVDNPAKSFLVYYNCGGDCFFARVAQFGDLPPAKQIHYSYLRVSRSPSPWFALQLPPSGPSRIVNNLTSTLVDRVLN